MHKTNFMIDLGIFAAFLVALEPRLTGETLHEWFSLAFAGVLIVHLLLHWKWVVNVGRNFFRKLWHTSRLKFVVNALLFTSFTVLMMSGLMISRSVLPIGTSTRPTLETLPASAKTFVPAEPSVPIARNQSAPLRMMAGTLA